MSINGKTDQIGEAFNVRPDAKVQALSIGAKLRTLDSRRLSD